MHAIEVEQTNSGPQLVWREVDDPVLQSEQVLVSIHATTLNRADLSQAAGNYPPPPGAPNIMGLDMAGEIIEVGPDVQGWQVGDKVCALLGGGGYAEQVAVDQQLLMPIPTGWSFEEAASLPEVYLTAYVNIFMEAGFQPGETILIHGGASGVGTAAIQMAKESGRPRHHNRRPPGQSENLPRPGRRSGDKLPGRRFRRPHARIHAGRRR